MDSNLTMTTKTVESRLCEFLPPRLLVSVYNLKFPYVKGQKLSGVQVGQFHFRPDSRYIQSFYDPILHDALVPLSEISLDNILQADLTALLPSPGADDYPEQCLGLITLLDQVRFLNVGYGLRYSRAFFDPTAKKLFGQLAAESEDERPYGKAAWINRGYSVDDWLIRVLWVFGPPVHSDTFMTQDRKTPKDWLHEMRSDVEQHAGVTDPFAKFEADDDTDITAFMRIFGEGPPQKSHVHPDREAAVSDYAFWWIRVLNAHFAVIDFAGRYPFWVRHKGNEFSDEDKIYMDKTNGYILETRSDALFEEIRQDLLKRVWKPLPPNPAFEHKRR